MIQILGDCVYEVTKDECGEATQLVGLLSEMTLQVQKMSYARNLALQFRNLIVKFEYNK